MVHDISASYNPNLSLSLYDKPIAFHRKLAEISGSVTSGLLLSQAIYWQITSDKKRGLRSWWWHTLEEWKEETCMTRYEFDKARNALISLGVLEQKNEGLPRRSWYRVNDFRLFSLLNVDNTVCRPSADSGVDPRQTNTESTSESTSDNICNIDDVTCDPETQNKPAQSNSPPIDSAGKRKRLQVNYPPEFEELWNMYPPRKPNDNKQAAYKAYKRRIQCGYSHEEMLAGVKKYAAFVKAEGTEPKYIKMASTFLGPNEFFLEDWNIPDSRKGRYAGMEQFKGRKIL